MPSLSEIARSLEGHEPTLVGPHDRARAAVAMILRERDAHSEMLFIERAKKDGDPWSGHMALPGGHLDPEDGGTRDAAERETLEEVGVSLRGSHHLGRLDDLEGRPQRNDGMVVSAHVFRVTDPEPLVCNHEVEHAFWFRVDELLDPERHVLYPHATYGGKRLPGILVGVPDRHIVWGLTYRFLDLFLSIIGRPLPDRWDDPR